jgi:hypothetical protein
MNIEDFKKRQNEVAKYADTIFSEEAATKSDYAILGGKNHQIIETAIIRVYHRLEESFGIDKNILNSKKEERNPPEYTFSFVTQVLINLLKDDGYLKKQLGDTKENKLYDEFYIFDNTKNFPHIYNPLSTLSNCLKHVMEKYKNESKYNGTPSLSPKAIPRRSIKYKRPYISSNLGILKNTNEILDRKLASGQTYRELLLEVARIYMKKSADDLLFESKIFNFGQTAITNINHKIANITYPLETKFVEFRATQNDIWKHFLKRDKDGRYRTSDKNNILKKLWNNQNIPIIFINNVNNEPVLSNRKLYNFDEILLPGKPEYFFSINLSAIEMGHSLNYVYLDLNELEKINKYMNEYWDKINTKSNNYKKIKQSLHSNQILKAAPIKFNILLKYRYNSGNNFENKNGYKGNKCHINDKELNMYLGDINTEIIKILKTESYIDYNHKKPEYSKPFKTARFYTLGSIFYCAKKLKWLISDPISKSNDGKLMWIFNLNTYYFTSKR